MHISRVIPVIVLTAALYAPASARDHFVLDGASMFTPAAVQNLDQKISSFNAQTGKEILVVTVPSLDGKTLQQATEDEFAHEQVNGVLIFMAKAEHQDALVGDRAARAFFPPGSFQSIRQAMRGYYRNGDFDTGIQTGVDLVLSQYRGHERATGERMRNAGIAPTGAAQQSFGGFGMFWFILIAFAGFLILRALLRALSGPRMMPPGYGGPGAPGIGGGYGTPGYGAPGYGGGGGGFGGGGFLSGMLGGLGGAWLGNQLFGNHGGNMIDGNQAAGFDGNQGAIDNTGWQSDPGQADMSGGSFGSFDDSSGGGFGGGGDSFGGGGGDGGGGGW